MWLWVCVCVLGIARIICMRQGQVTGGRWIIEWGTHSWLQTNGKLNSNRSWAEVRGRSYGALELDDLEKHSEHLLPWLKYIKQKHNLYQAEKCMPQ